MKNLIIAVALATSGIAHAETLAQIPNKAGGQIRFTDTECNATGNIVYGRRPSGQTSVGCWISDGETMFVKWSNGRIYTYPVSSLRAANGEGNGSD